MAEGITRLGEKYRDVLSGFEGYATGRFIYLYGCVRVQLEMAKDGELQSEVFDEQRLTRVGGEAVQTDATSGGPRPNPPSRRPPRR